MPDDLVKLWEHPQISSTSIDSFRLAANAQFDQKLQSYHDIWEWSTECSNDFWMLVWSFTKVVAQVEPTFAIHPCQIHQLHPRPTWFPEARLNLAQNVLEGVYGQRNPTDVVLTGIREGGEQVEHVRLKLLRERVARLSNALASSGARKGDRIAVVGTNSIDTFVVFLAAAAIGAIFTICSPETGEKGILDRFLQVQPKFLFADDFQVYNGKHSSCVEKITRVVERLQGLRLVVLMPRFPWSSTSMSHTSFVDLQSWTANFSNRCEYAALAFDDPLIIVYTSGTTGQPKCLVHTVGGVLVKQKLEQILCMNMDQSSVLLQYTSTNWIMYIYSALGLLSGARSVLYDGSPMMPSRTGLLEILAKHQVTHFGTSAQYLNILEQNGVKKDDFPHLHNLKAISSTGSVLTEPQFYWVYKTFGAVQLSSIAGGTDIAGAFVGGAPNLPVYAGWCQARTLGMKVQIFSDDGCAIESTGEPGELVCTAPFPSQPAFFWNDGGGKRYHAAYFEKYPGVWTQGDFVRMEASTQGIQFLGRSDGVLNPSGIRFGSAEIYSCLATIPEIEDSLCVGQRRSVDSNERVILFVKLKEGHQLDERLKSTITKCIRTDLSPRHVPAFVFQAPDIPVTINGKKTEVPVKKIVSGLKTTISSTIVNPESLEWYQQFAALDHNGKLSRQSKL